MDDRVPVPGSERIPMDGAQKKAQSDPLQQLQVSIYVRPKEPLPAVAETATGQQTFLSRDEFAARYGADPEDLRRVEEFVVEHGLVVAQVDQGRRVMVVEGTARAMGKAFGVDLADYEHSGGTYRGREGPITVPATLHGVIVSVHGLDNRPAASAKFQVIGGATPRADGGPYTPVEVARAYDFPTDSDGAGECVAIIELGGGYTASDLASFFTNAGISPAPTVLSVGVDGATNTPSPTDNADVEVALDIEVVGAVAPGARQVVYFGPNTDQGFLDAITTAAHDATNKPSVMSISWGSPESNWTAQSLQSFDQAFQAAALMGVTVCCASGDGGSADGTTDGLAHADFPASSPNALGCGGTRLSETGGKITNEVVWNEGTGATGGGISDVFPPPAYQSAANVPPSANPGGRVGRGVPDVSGDAAPSTGYQIFVNGATTTVGGTSAVAPLWAGLLARINAAKKSPSGLVHPILYAHPTAFHDITTGNNGAYHAGPGWDPCTGLGSPDGKLIEQALNEVTPGPGPMPPPGPGPTPGPPPPPTPPPGHRPPKEPPERLEPPEPGRKEPPGDI